MIDFNYTTKKKKPTARILFITLIHTPIFFIAQNLKNNNINSE